MTVGCQLHACYVLIIIFKIITKINLLQVIASYLACIVLDMKLLVKSIVFENNSLMKLLKVVMIVTEIRQ